MSSSMKIHGSEVFLEWFFDIALFQYVQIIIFVVHLNCSALNKQNWGKPAFLVLISQACYLKIIL